MNNIKSLQANIFKQPQILKQRVHSYLIDKVLNFYEKWVIPPNSVSLRQLKLQEFEDRKRLLHPYERDKVISENMDTDRVIKLQRKARMRTMHTFTLTYSKLFHYFLF